MTPWWDRPEHDVNDYVPGQRVSPPATGLRSLFPSGTGGGFITPTPGRAHFVPTTDDDHDDEQRDEL